MWFLHQVLINSWILSTCSSCLRKLPSISSLSCSIKGLGQASGFAVLWIFFFFLKQKINIATLQESTADIIQCCYRNHRCVPKQNISMKSEAEHRMPHCACTTIRQSPEKKQWSLILLLLLPILYRGFTSCTHIFSHMKEGNELSSPLSNQHQRFQHLTPTALTNAATARTFNFFF